MRNPSMIFAGRLFAAALAFTLASAPALAEKPEWAGGGKGGKHEKHKDHDDDDHGKGGKHGKHGKHGKRNDERREVRVGGYFVDRDRVVVREYYEHEYRGRKHCPPGLAKKNNGCMPPGQAKKVYMVGQPLPATVVYYPVPQPVLVTLPPPPPQHKYVRIAGDILLIAVGSSMVVDALNDITR
jgi:Ni/Co efflux regulator RcnB